MQNDGAPWPLVFHIINDLCDGGAEAVLYRLVTADREVAHVVVSLLGPGKYGPKLINAGIEVHCLEMRRGVFNAKAPLKLISLLRSRKPSVVQTWMYHSDFLGGLVARFMRVRNVCWGIRNSTLEPGKSKWLTIQVVRSCALLSRHIPRYIVTPSRRAAEVHSAMGYAADKFRVIANGYDLHMFSPDPTARGQLRKEWGVGHATFLFGMVARFDPQKDHSNLLSALASLRKHGNSFRCVLVGSGIVNDNTELSQLIETHGMSDIVELLGPRDDIPRIMNTLDLHVLSSAYGEAFPNVIAEAMACGTPCVATDVGDVASIIGETGWIVAPGDETALASALEAAMTAHTNTNEWKARRNACRQRIAQQFDLKRMVAAYRSVWELPTAHSQAQASPVIRGAGAS